MLILKSNYTLRKKIVIYLCIVLLIILSPLQSIVPVKAAQPAESLENVALKTEVTITQNLLPASPDYRDREKRLSFLNDGITDDTGKHWDGGYEPASFTMDLGYVYNIKEFKLYPYHNDTLEYIQHYNIEVSQDGQTFTQVAEKNDDKAASMNPDIYQVDTTARYVKVTCKSGGGASNFNGCHCHVVEFEVYAEPDPVKIGSELTIKRDSFMIPKGIEATLPISATDEYGHVISNATVDWKTNPEGIVTVDNGTVKSIGVGKTTVIAICQETGKSASCDIEVYDSHTENGLQDLATGKVVSTNVGALNPEKIVNGVIDSTDYWSGGNVPAFCMIDLGKTYGLTEFKIYPYFDAEDYYWYQYEIWCGETKEKLAKVAESKDLHATSKEGDFYGLTVPIKAQFVKVVVTGSNCENPSYKEYDTAHLCEVQVFGFDGKASTESVLTIDSDNLQLDTGKKHQFTAVAKNQWDEDVSINNVWSSDNTDIVMIDSKTGLATAVKEGSATITVENTTLGKKASCFIIVRNEDQKLENVALRNEVKLSQLLNPDTPDYDAREKKLSYLNDGLKDDPGKHWDAGYEPASFIMDLGYNYNIQEFKLYPYHNDTLEYIQHYSIEVSQDGSDFVKVAEKTDDKLASASPDTYLVDTIGRFVKVTCISGGGASNFTRCHCHVVEFEVYAAPDPVEIEPRLTINRSSIMMPIGIDANLLVESTDKYGKVDKNAAITWNVNPTGVVTVENGVIKSLAAGKTTVTATCQETEQSVSCEVEVYDAIVTDGLQELEKKENVAATSNLAIDGIIDSSNFWDGGNVPAAYEMDLGKTYGLTEFKIYPRFSDEVKCWFQYEIWCGEYENNLTKVAEKKDYEFSSSEGDFYGLSIPQKARFIKIVFTASNRENSAAKQIKLGQLCEVQVFGFDGQVPVDPVTMINRHSLKLPIGNTYQFTAKAFNEWAEIVEEGNEWSSNNAEIVSIDAVSGKMTAKTAGKAVITVVNKTTGAEDKCEVEVYDPNKVSGKIVDNNVALNKPVESIAQVLIEGRAYHITDGDKSTFWSVTEPSEFVIDLKAEYDLNRIAVFAPYEEDKIYSYDIYISNDDRYYEHVIKNTDAQENVDGKNYIFDQPKTGRYIKVKMNGNNISSDVGIYELEAYANVYAEPAESILWADSDEITLPIGRTKVLMAKGWDEWKKEVDDIVYTSKDNTIVTIDSKGNIKAISAGRTTIEITSMKANKTISIDVEIYNPEDQTGLVTSVNVALNKPVTPAPIATDGIASSITDGDRYTFWAVGQPSEFVIDLEEEYDLKRLMIYTYYGEGRTYLYDIYTKTKDGTEYEHAFKNTDVMDTSEGKAYKFDQPKKARYIKVTMHGNNLSQLVGLYEFEAYADAYTEPVESVINVNKDGLTMPLGRTTTLKAEAWDEWKHKVGDLEFTSTDENIVVVDSDGTVKSIAPGNAYIEVSSKELNKTKRVLVEVYDKAEEKEEIKIAIFWPPTAKYVNEEQYDYIKEANFNRVLGTFNADLRNYSMAKKIAKLCADRDMDFITGEGGLAGPSIENEDIKSAIEKYQYMSGIGGFYIVDEPWDPSTYAQTYKQIKHYWPEAYPHINFLPNIYPSEPEDQTYEYMLEKYAKNVGDVLEYIMFDRYPFGLADQSFDAYGMFNNLDVIRKVCLKYGVKPAAYLQSIGIPGSLRKPNEAEVRYNVAMCLAYGYKQLAYFTYFQPENQAQQFTTAIMDANGNKTELYEPVKEINRQIKNLSPTLINLDAVNVYHHGSLDGQQEIPTDFIAQVDGNSNVIISHMIDKQTDAEYIMVVNKDFVNNQNIKLIFKDNVKALQEVSKDNGQFLNVALNDENAISVQFEAGEGKLFAINPHIHEYGEKWECDEESHWKECTCGDKKDIAVHSFGPWNVTRQSTTTEEGIKERTCTICGYLQTERIPKMTPDPTPIPTTDETEPDMPAVDEISVEFTNAPKKMLLGEKYDIKIEVKNCPDMSKLRWMTTRKNKAMVGKNWGKDTATVYATSLGKETLVILYDGKEVARTPINVVYNQELNVSIEGLPKTLIQGQEYRASIDTHGSKITKFWWNSTVKNVAVTLRPTGNKQQITILANSIGKDKVIIRLGSRTIAEQEVKVVKK